MLGRIRYHAVLTRYNAEMLRLDSPTTMYFIDPIFMAHNRCCEYILKGGVHGFSALPKALDLPVVDAWSRRYDIDVSDIFIGGLDSVGADGEWRLTVSGEYSTTVAGFPVTIPLGNIALDGPFPEPAIADVEDAVTDEYGASGTITVTPLVNTAIRKKFSVQFTGPVGSSGTASYDLIYDYTKI